MEEREMNKKLYKGIFNLRGDVITKYTHANSEDQAFRLICKLISKDMNLTNDIDIRHYFWGTNYFEIKEVISDEEQSRRKERD
jgi:hypothetical protein